MKVKAGRYRHFKGKMYEVIAVAKHSETLEDYVVYKALYKNTVAKFWLRPLDNFTENVTVNNKPIPRFKYLTYRKTKPKIRVA